MGKKKKQKDKNINRSVPLGKEKKEQKGEGLKEGLAFLFWGYNPLLIEPLSLGVLLKRILLVLDNVLAACFSISSIILLYYYGRGMDWHGAMDATGSYICGHPVLMSVFFILLTLAYWRPIKHTKLMPFSHYVTDLVFGVFGFIWIVFLSPVVHYIVVYADFFCLVDRVKHEDPVRDKQAVRHADIVLFQEIRSENGIPVKDIA